MSALREKQSRFVEAIGRLILYAHSIGYELTFGDAYRDPRVFGKLGEKKGYGHSNSAHKARLAVDFNLFIDGEYMGNGVEHNRLHDFWDQLGGATRIKEDLNHYSFEHEGVR